MLSHPPKPHVPLTGALDICRYLFYGLSPGHFSFFSLSLVEHFGLVPVALGTFSALAVVSSIGIYPSADSFLFFKARDTVAVGLSGLASARASSLVTAQ